MDYIAEWIEKSLLPTLHTIMELKEINTIPLAHHDGLIPFALQKSEDGYYSLATRQPLEIFHLNYKHSEDSELRLLNTTFDTSKSIPTQFISNDPFTLYDNANDQEKKQLCLDVMLLPEVSQMPHNPATISVQWAPTCSATKQHSYLACLTNYGGCNVKYHKTIDREWCADVADIGRLWFNYWAQQDKVTQSQCTSFPQLQSAVSDIHITAITWNNRMVKNQSFLACISASGKLCVFQIKTKISNEPISIQIVADLSMQKVNSMRWFTVSDGSVVNGCVSIMVFGDLLGNIALYEVSFEMDIVKWIHKRADLWTYNDNLRCGDICIECDENLNQFMILVCKGSYVLVFVIHADNFNVIDTQTYYVGNLFVSGVVRIKPLTYAICALGGTIKQLEIEMTESSVRIIDKDIRCNIDFAKYSLYGITTSENQTMWFLALFPRQVSFYRF